MSDSPPPVPPRPVLDVWCELQCPDCRSALDDLRALRARYGDRAGDPAAALPAGEAQARLRRRAGRRGGAGAGPGLGVRRGRAGAGRGAGPRGASRCWSRWRGELGLDAEEFDTALIDGRHILVVDADQAEGKAIGVTGTPTYVIGGERLDGGKSQEGLRERIEEIADRLLAGLQADARRRPLRSAGRVRHRRRATAAPCTVMYRVVP